VRVVSRLARLSSLTAMPNSFVRELCSRSRNWIFWKKRILPVETCWNSCSQSYDRELQRQRCKNLQRNFQRSGFLNKNCFSPIWNALAYIVAVNFKS
jgi:hypothetical protein